MLTNAAYVSAAINALLPFLITLILTHGPVAAPAPQQYLLIKSFSLLLLGLSLSALATLNFSLSFMVGLLCAPLTFVTRVPRSASAPLRYTITVVGLALLNLLSPVSILLGACWYFGVSVEHVLTRAAFGWNVWGMWTQVVVWCVWWPAWLIGCVSLSASVF